MTLTTHVMFLVKELYKTEEGGSGCCLHIVTDDGNIEDGSVKFCLDQAIKENHTKCIEIAALMLHMTKTQRNKIYHHR